MAFTEADEIGDRDQVLAALCGPVLQGETMGVRQMYEEAARKLGATVAEVASTRARP